MKTVTYETGNGATEGRICFMAPVAAVALDAGSDAVCAFHALYYKVRIRPVFKSEILKESIQGMTVNSVGDGGVYYPDAVGLDLGYGNVDEVQFPFLCGRRGDGAVHRSAVSLIVEGKSDEN